MELISITICTQGENIVVDPMSCGGKNQTQSPVQRAFLCREDSLSYILELLGVLSEH